MSKQDVKEKSILEEIKVEDIERPKKINSGLKKLMTSNPRDPEFLKSSAKIAKRSIIRMRIWNFSTV